MVVFYVKLIIGELQVQISEMCHYLLLFIFTSPCVIHKTGWNIIHESIHLVELESSQIDFKAALEWASQTRTTLIQSTRTEPWGSSIVYIGVSHLRPTLHPWTHRSVLWQTMQSANLLLTIESRSLAYYNDIRGWFVQLTDQTTWCLDLTALSTVLENRLHLPRDKWLSVHVTIHRRKILGSTLGQNFT